MPPEPDPLLSDPRVDALARERLAERMGVWRTDPRAFRMQARRLETGALYGQVFEPWQEEHFFEPVYAGKSLWNESPRGHDRTDGEGWVICDHLQHGPPNQRIDIFAADRDQARYPLERAERYTREDRHLFPDVRVRENRIEGPRGSVAVVNAAEVAGSLGGKPTEVWCEEIGVWPEKGRKLWNSILGSCMKLGAPIRVLTNPGAGKVGNWRWDAREFFRKASETTPERWHFWSPGAWVAKWSLDRRRELEGAFTSENERRRFLDGQWLEQDEYPAFAKADIDAIYDTKYEIRDGQVFVEGQAPVPILAFIQATDYGLTNDALCAGVLALDAIDRVFVVDDYAAAGRPGSAASLLAVEAWMLERMGLWPIEATLFDPYQAVHTMQEFGTRLSAEEYQFSGASKRRHYAALLAAVRAHRFKAREGMFRRIHAGGHEYDLRRELVEAVEKVSPTGSVMDHPEGGHLDAGVTCAMACERLAEFTLSPGAVYAPKVTPRTLGWKQDPRLRGARR